MKGGRTEALPQSAEAKFSLLHAGFLTLLHLGALASFAYLTWQNVALALALNFTTGAGLVIGYHRLLAHRSFAAPRWLETALVLLGTLALEGGPIRWSSKHRQHHACADGDDDPHDVSRGLMYAHMGWILFQYDASFEMRRSSRYARDILKRPLYRWLDRYYYLPSLALGAALFVVGGVPAFLWGMCSRLVVLYHSTWLLNSVCHRWGSRRFENAAGRNNWWVAVLTLGEGWHNNHHAHPSSARCGIAGAELDPAWLVIRTLELLGLARDVVVPRSSNRRLHAVRGSPARSASARDVR